ncbi:MAG TPA: hypothetical protein VHY37_05670, partial [Tepidisphaeraceae bacterium]|nr:hypothetical protein [Tepidisphaeraceae bacterium]
ARESQGEEEERILLVPDALPSKVPDTTPRIRIMWGHHLLEDLLLGRYRSVVCAVNGKDNSRGIIAQLVSLVPTSQWTEKLVTAQAAQLADASSDRVRVMKFDLDLVEVLAVLRPPGHNQLTLNQLASAFGIIAEMVKHRPNRWPSASVSFLGARANRLVDSKGREPSFEAVLKVMYEAGYYGDVYPSPAMWKLSHVGVFARYPFSGALDRMREGGF